MWTRHDLKVKAKAFYKKFFLNSVIAGFIVTLAVAGFKSGQSGAGSSGGTVEQGFDGVSTAVNTLTPGIILMIFALGGILILFGFLFAIGAKVFIGGPLEVAGKKFFLKGALNEEDANLSHLGSSFRKEHYFNIVWTMFYRGLITFLHFFLLMVPGIIKVYAYSMVPYILAEDPNIEAKEALRLSEEMTFGHKMDIFVLDLSFLGWYLLGSLFFGIGIHLVNPYIYATKAQLYIALKYGSQMATNPTGYMPSEDF